MTKQEAIDFINALQEDSNGRIFFYSYEILDTYEQNRRSVYSTKAMMVDRLTHHFDDSLHGSYRDGRLTTIQSMGAIE